nr:SAM-dependent methyltransferase [Neosynechococcus sphagnicola]
MTPIHVVGIGLDGSAGLTATVQQLVTSATVLVGSPRHLSYFPQHPAERLVLTDLTLVIAALRQRLTVEASATQRIVILTSGDPLFSVWGVYYWRHSPQTPSAFTPTSVPCNWPLTASRFPGKMPRS